MKKKSLVALVLCAILILGIVPLGGCATQGTPGQLIEDVSPQRAYNLIQENQNNLDFVIIDVRTPGEFAEGHVANAVNIDFNSASFDGEIAKLDRDKAYVIYCRSGNRSRGALAKMTELGFTEIYHLEAGIIGWLDAGLPTVK